MLSQRELKDGTVKVTFEVEHLADADEVQLLGDFNDWTPETMKKYKNGKHKTTVSLEPNQRYEFLYLVEGEQWETDEDAETVVSAVGTENSVVVC
ncbi:MAG: isoamylase early set domain-containing protein [Anaerolineales bacterium]|nr:isoamylase early set domain-containing protein [Anaerolineales bacterium]MCB9172388.1 isoamylase early set domain-containing protein [Ardenticatenales bacterium]